MTLKKYRWSRYYESAEEELQSAIGDAFDTAERWLAVPGEQFEPHVHDYDKTLWCVDGSIIFDIDGRTYSMQAGDALSLPANTKHSAVAGLSGCVCYESQS